MPKLQCICGSVTIILKNKFQEKRGELKVCKCKRNKVENVGCFSKNCPNYLECIRKRYNIIWDHLTWTLVDESQLLTPLFSESMKYNM
jgi:iron-sulfur cluster repair protein YtfE (RIC family)